MDQEIGDLLTAPNFAHIATARRDGSASVTPPDAYDAFPARILSSAGR